MFTILVCDDEKDIVDAIEIYLAQEGYRVLKAYDGLQALEIFKDRGGTSDSAGCDDAEAGWLSIR